MMLYLLQSNLCIDYSLVIQSILQNLIKTPYLQVGVLQGVHVGQHLGLQFLPGAPVSALQLHLLGLQLRLVGLLENSLQLVQLRRVPGGQLSLQSLQRCLVVGGDEVELGAMLVGKRLALLFQLFDVSGEFVQFGLPGLQLGLVLLFELPQSGVLLLGMPLLQLPPLLLEPVEVKRDGRTSV